VEAGQIGVDAERKWLLMALNGIRKTLRVLSRLEALEDPFALTSRQVRVFQARLFNPLWRRLLGVREHPSNGPGDSSRAYR